ncbi:hypothetical protein AB0D04_37355 [Streptomyces sp. NPDC048483]|uniref:hypothetical protein n=1 Tax=Streptomyces sp. NPDC048483 TaxID=3154927 RepID=UPI00344927A4
MSERMPSHIASVFFTVHVNGAWRPTPEQAHDHHDPSALAGHHLRQYLAPLLRRHSVLDPVAARDTANTALAHWLPAPAGLEVTGAVQLAVSARARDLAEEHARRQQAADLAHEDEVRHLTHLQRVLADPDLRQVWWIAQYPDRYQELTPLATALKDLPLPHETTDDDIRGEIRRFTDRLLTALHTPEQREVFLQALTQALHTLGHHDLKTTATHWQAAKAPGSPSA